MEVWYLWFVITIAAGHLRHYPVDEAYATQAACEEHLPEWKEIIVLSFPGDENLRVYCKSFRPSEIPT